MKNNIIIDCDPGIDDAVALCVAFANKEKLNILGITTVAGNQTIENVTDNALKLCEFFGHNDPVIMGSNCPLVREKKTASKIHGKTGLGNTVLPKANNDIVGNNAVRFMFDTISNLSQGEKVTLVPIGPLTNIAILLKAFPEIASKIERICLMGGGIGMGNVTSFAEFNFWADPEAAKIVFDFPIPKIMCGLNVTSKTGFTRTQVEELLSSDKFVAQKLGEMVEFYFNSPAYENSKIVAIHDATAIMYILHPEMFVSQKVNVTVNISCDEKRGAVVENLSPIENDVLAVMDTDSVEFSKKLLECIYSF